MIITIGELSKISILETLERYTNLHKGIDPNSNEIYIRKLYVETINYLKGLKSTIIKELSIEI